MMKKRRYGVISIVIRNSIQYFKKARLWGVAEQSVAIVRALLLTAGIIATQNLFDVVTSTGIKDLEYWRIINSLIFLVFIIVGQHLLSGMGQYLLSKVSYSNMGKFMADFQLKLGRISAEKFEDAQFLDDVERAKRCLEYESLGHFASSCLQLFTYYTVLFVSLGGYLFWLSPILPFVLLIAFIPAILGQLTQMNVFMKLAQENAPLKRQCEYYKKAIVDRLYYKETRMLGGFQYFHKLFSSTLDEMTQKTWKTKKKVISWKLLLNIVSFMGLGASIFILFQLTMLRQISVGAFASIFAALSQIFTIMEEVVATCLSEGSENIAQVTNFYRLIDMEEVDGSKDAPDFAKGITVENVSFTYPGANQEALKNVSFSIKCGETIAIVGENGSGKSTLIRVLMGLYTSNSGTIKVGGKSTRGIHPKTLYRSVSGVFQNYQRYKMSLEENVIISDVESLQETEKVNEVLKESEFNEDNITLDSMLSPEFDGVDLSGGQWQRLAIARGLYRVHDFIVLDEPTAAIDPIEEARLYNHFRQIVKGKCAIIVTHRLGSAKLADRIVVMNNGQLVEIGTHEELLALKGRYETMWNSQTKWYEH